MKISSTKQKARFIKMVIYGVPGVGKTPLGATAPKPIIIDAESGTLYLSDQDIPTIEIEDFDGLEEAYEWLDDKKNRKPFETVVIDSGTEVAEFVLADLKKEAKDNRQAYMALGDRAMEVFRLFKDLPMHVVMICHAKVVESDGVEIHRAGMPGKALVEKIPYLVDEYLALRVSDDEGGFKYLQTRPTFDWDAKDRSGTLDPMEEPDLTKIFRKILKGKKSKK